MPALGDEFRAAREARHLTLSDVSEQIHIRTTYLECIEREEWSAIAAPVYVKGFIRTYARFLGLDQEEAVRAYLALVADGAVGSQPPPRPAPGRNAPPPREPSPLLWVAGVVAVALVAFVAWTLYQSRAQSGAAPVALATAVPSLAPAALASKPPLPGETARHTLTVRIKADSWLLVEVDGTTAAEGVLTAGTQKTFHGAKIALRTGNAGGVDVIANGKDFGTLGASGDVVERTFDLTKE